MNSNSYPKVSVIVPVYNVAPYIEKCARSLFEQTLEDIEILFVDDCGTDNSIEIIRNFLQFYPNRINRTKFIKMPSNCGLAAVRRKGILESKGDYIIHCDGDDWADTDLYEKMFLEAIKSGADIVMCGEIYEYANYSTKHEVRELSSNGLEVVKNWYKDTLGMFCHDKMVKRSLYFDNEILPWPGLNMWEDNGLMTRLFCFANKLSKISGSYYHYNRANVNAMTNGYGEKQVRQMIGIAENLSDFFHCLPNYDEVENTALAFQYLAKLNLITDSYSRLREYYKLFPESNKVIKYIPLHSFSSKGKIRFLMVKYHLSFLFVTLFKLRNLICKISKR